MIEVIEYYNWIIEDWINGYYANGSFLLMGIIAFIYLYVSCKELRYKFLLPIFLMLFITVNPILYMYVFRRIIYWRLLWMLPISILIAATVIVLLKRTSNIWVKWGMLLVVSAFIVSQGKYMFSYEVFVPRSNWEKISQETIDVCDYILSIDDTPKAVLPETIFSEVRQYAPEINMMYGRNAHGYITDILEPYLEVYQQIKLDSPDYWIVLHWTTHYNFNFVVVDENKEIGLDVLEAYNYKEIKRIGKNIIYYNENFE